MDIDVFNKVYALLSMVVLYFLFKIVFDWKKGLDKKNLNLMQLYLELKFLYKNLILSTQTSSSENFCIELILAIKEYYNLEEVIVVDSIHMEFKTRTISLLKKKFIILCNVIYTPLKKNLKLKM